MNARDDDFFDYKGDRIISKCKNAQPQLYVIIVGYDQDDDKKDYLIGKNNWGEDWGDKGFFKIYPDTCGILMTNDYLY